MKLGTAIATVAKPIARTLDDVWGTDLEHCPKCNKMEQDLNNARNVWDFVDAVKERFSSQQEENNGNTSE